jgi:hypothetical protein
MLQLKNILKLQSLIQSQLLVQIKPILLKRGTVNSASDHGTITLTDLNNDAVKFTITGENDPTALVSVDLTMEPLNPYVNNVDIVAKQTGVRYSTDFSAVSSPMTSPLATASHFNVPTWF